METRLTPLCHAAHGLVDRIRQFADEKVLPAMLKLEDDKGRPSRRLDATVYEAYALMVLWVGSIAKLNETKDVQAIGAGARSLFEQLLDLKWLEQNPQPEWSEKFHEFPRVDRYRLAEKVLDYKNNNPDSQISEKKFREIMAMLNRGEPVAAVVARLWGKNPKTGNLNWPRHWTGEADILGRAKKLGSEFADAYQERYRVLCWLVHSGSSAFHGRDSESIENYVAHGYLWAFEFAHQGTKLACEILGIAGNIPDFDAEMKQLWDGRTETVRIAPRST